MCANLPSNKQRCSKACGTRLCVPKNADRKKIWQLEHRFHCSVAGTCFTLSEMRQFCRKAQVKINSTTSDYVLHTHFVAIIGDPQAARPAAKYLDRKFKHIIQQFDQVANTSELAAMWNKSVSNGNLAAAYWAVLTHPMATEALLFQVYGEVHMLSHLSGASIRLDMQAFVQLKKRVPKLESEIENTRAALLRRTRKKDAIIASLTKRLDDAKLTEKKLMKAKEKIKFMESGEMIRYLRTQVMQFELSLSRQRTRLERAQADAKENLSRATRAEQKMMMLREEYNALENRVNRSVFQKESLCDKANTCNYKIDLAGRCILYVGGHNRLCAHFRTFVEKQNGCFIHHDGGREDNPHRLAALLTQVDAVLCPMDCVSHDAVNRIRRDCKRYGKHLTLLPQSSLSAFTKGVYEFSKATALAV